MISHKTDADRRVPDVESELASSGPFINKENSSSSKISESDLAGSSVHAINIAQPSNTKPLAQFRNEEVIPEGFIFQLFTGLILLLVAIGIVVRLSKAFVSKSNWGHAESTGLLKYLVDFFGGQAGRIVNEKRGSRTEIERLSSQRISTKTVIHRVRVGSRDYLIAESTENVSIESLEMNQVLDNQIQGEDNE